MSKILKDVNNPKTTDALEHLKEMFENARLALIDGRSLVLISSIDVGEQYLNQDLFNEVTRDIRYNFMNYSVNILNKMKVD